MSDDLTYDTDGWTPVPPDEGGGDVAFARPPGDLLSTHAFDLPPDIGAPLDELDAIRRRYREQLALRGAAVISLDTTAVDGIPSLELVFKTAQEPSGMIYVGSLTIPFRDASYVLKVQCNEVGVTGTRDAIVMNGVLKEVGGDLEQAMAVWTRDPHDPTFRAPLLRNQADDEAWDVDFPDHPLSRVRAHLRHLRATTRLSERAKARAPYGS
ncbi:MAG: hypothetical protein K8M05_15345 [Deltaproteobacteria bacterium]|nr:hypothetical protein [Kofleriaceae bacterium]